MHRGASWRMRLHQKLRRRLSKIPDLILYSLPYQRISDRVQLYATFVRQIIENVGSAHGLWTYKKKEDNRNVIDKNFTLHFLS